MLGISLGKDRHRPLRLLCLGAHSDDIEIGCGGTILRLLAQGAPVEACWVVFGARGPRAQEARRSASLFLAGAHAQRVLVRNHRDGFFPIEGGTIKEEFEKLKRSFAPDVVLTHYRDDRHQDHRVISDLTWNTFRDHLILEYEVPKYDGDLGIPNFFVPLDEETCMKKIGHILDNFPSQRAKHWFTAETFRAMLRLRGIESCAPYAEAFHCRKIVMQD